MANRLLDKIDSLEAPLYEYVNSRFIDNPKEKRDFWKQFDDYFGFENKRRRHTWLYGGRKGTETAKGRLNKIRLLYLGFGIPPSIFHAEIDDLITTGFSPDIDFVEVFEMFSDREASKNEENETAFAERYENIVAPYIVAASKITIYEYLGRGSLDILDPDTVEYYEKANEKAFRLIEQKFGSIEYERYIALPVQRQKSNNSDCREAVINLCSLNTLSHIHKCVSTKHTGIRVFAVETPSILGVYALFERPNGERHVLIESYRHTRKNRYLPEFIFISKIPLQTDHRLYQLYESYKLDIQDLRKHNTDMQIMPHHLKDFTMKLFEASRKARIEYEQTLDQEKIENTLKNPPTVNVKFHYKNDTERETHQHLIQQYNRAEAKLKLAAPDSFKTNDQLSLFRDQEEPHE